jgi:hypothetical protein
MLGREARDTHEMRNEFVEELSADLPAKIIQNWKGSPSEWAQLAGWRAKQAEERKKGGPAGESEQKAPLGEANLSEKGSPSAVKTRLSCR